MHAWYTSHLTVLSQLLPNCKSYIISLIDISLAASSSSKFHICGLSALRHSLFPALTAVPGALSPLTAVPLVTVSVRGPRGPW